MGEVTLQIYISQDQNGPGKVVKNLLMGLNELNINYTLNQAPIEGTKKLALSKHQIMNTHIEELFIGPNICVLPVDEPIVMSQRYKKYIVNSNWTYNAYSKWILDDKLAIWPVGIDTDLFSDKSLCSKTNDCLIYFKRRDKDELQSIIKFLNERNQSFEIIEYGSYVESDFIKTIERSKYSIVIDNCESQGIAIQEMMSCNLPLLVWDVTHWDDRGEEFRVESSSSPYWNEVCGIKVFNLQSIKDSFDDFKNNLENFNPREYIIKNLSIDKCTRLLLNIIKHK